MRPAYPILAYRKINAIFSHLMHKIRHGAAMPKKSSTLSLPRAKQNVAPVVAIVMGSQSDWVTMEHAMLVLRDFGVAHVVQIISAHRTPQRLVAFAEQAAAQGLQVIIAGAGGAAHLPGMIAALTRVPVLGVPVESKALQGMDSLLSIVQMPGGIPVGTLAIGKAGAINAALLAVAILALQDAKLAKAYQRWRDQQTASVAHTPV
jgi:5-(carboxyamino)imidazole ribonucleotide mutase